MIKRLIIVSCLLIVSGCSTLPVSQDTNPHILIETDYGNIEAVLYVDKAPITANNFLMYIEKDLLGDATFYRVVRLNPDNQPNNEIKIEVVQGGIFEEDHPDHQEPIEHETTIETGLKHLDGTLSMARWGPGTATIDFSICIGAQPELDFKGRRNADNWGFAAFGQVVKGMDVVHKIHQIPTEGQYLTPQVPMNKVSVIKK